ncbi:MAG: STAS domain-containing protein [Candidatus Kapabacteria bacterium]|nr:STAS domain-containing protein [Ignavibacteriota bacterium]MCW5885472.1 STAS domain-containing protein [Candidatus Kapabacteria bacterium]
MINPEYKISNFSEKPNAASVKLVQSVLGGNDALLFTSILNELTASGKNCIIIDAGEVQLMNSTGIGMLANAHSNLTKNGYTMMIVNIPEKIMKLLAMTHLDRVFKIYPDLESALKNC